MTPAEFQARMAPVWETCRRMDAEWAGARKERPVMAGDRVRRGTRPRVWDVTAIDSTHGKALIVNAHGVRGWAPIDQLEVIR